jgi:hypothetical protein
LREFTKSIHGIHIRRVSIKGERFAIQADSLNCGEGRLLQISSKEGNKRERESEELD